MPTYLKLTLSLALFSLAMWISMTRVSDYRHHLVDVLCGIILGGVVGLIGGFHSTTVGCSDSLIRDFNDGRDDENNHISDPKNIRVNKHRTHEDNSFRNDAFNNEEENQNEQVE